MANCDRKRFKRTKLCAGDLRNSIAIQTRELRGATINNNQPTVVFTTVATIKCGIKTTHLYSSLYTGINIADRPTHIFTVRKNSITKIVEFGNNFILFDGRYFKITGRTINNEDPYFVDIQSQERGIDSLSANEA